MDTKLIIAILSAKEAGERALLHENATNTDYAKKVVESLEKSGYVIEQKVDLQRIGYLPKDGNKNGFHAG